MRSRVSLFLLSSIIAFLCLPAFAAAAQHVYRDVPFWQDYSEKFTIVKSLAQTKLREVKSDRNGVIQVASTSGILRPSNGKLVIDKTYRPLLGLRIIGLDSYRSQFVYLTSNAVFSNAWAGKFYFEHDMPQAQVFAMGNDFDVLIADSNQLAYFSNTKKVWSAQLAGSVPLDIQFDSSRNQFLVLTENQIYAFTPADKKFTPKYESTNLTCMDLATDATELIVGTTDGFFKLYADKFTRISAVQKKLPCADIRCVKGIGEKIWFGTSRGAFALSKDGRIDYYASGRWLVDDRIVDIAAGPGNSVLVLSRKGLSQIGFKKMTLHQKAEHFDKLTRQRHVRYGLNSKFVMSKAGDFSIGALIDDDNDGLWTAMYLAGELFRYAVTESEDALQNCYEAFEAMERLDFINPLKGFPSRSFERQGFKIHDKDRWQLVGDGVWEWKATTSSDEIVGHFFAYSNFAEIVKDQKWRTRAINQIDRGMDHIVRNNWYLVDHDGKPTQWGKWHPDYVNQFPKVVGDRCLNSAEIISFLQTAYHFTGKQVYKTKAFELMDKYGYLDNIMIPISTVSKVPAIDSDIKWNHSDDELAFLTYWNLYKYAFNDELREKYRQAIKEYWNIERPEKNPLWNFVYAMTGAKDFDLEESIWSLREFPLDTVAWDVRNSQRKDLEFLPGNFREQTTRVVLPPDERPMRKYNANAFDLDGREGGLREYSGDIFLLPYWMGRYLDVIKE